METKQRILLCEDEESLGMLLREYLQAKGYDPITQIVGYLISGDPTYITSYNNARYLIRMLERDELLEELVKFMDYNVRRRFKLVQSSMSLDLSDMKFILLARMNCKKMV